MLKTVLPCGTAGAFMGRVSPVAGRPGWRRRAPPAPGRCAPPARLAAPGAFPPPRRPATAATHSRPGYSTLVHLAREFPQDSGPFVQGAEDLLPGGHAQNRT